VYIHLCAMMLVCTANVESLDLDDGDEEEDLVLRFVSGLSSEHCLSWARPR